MESNQLNSRLISLHQLHKDRQNGLQFIRNEVEKETGKTISQLIIEYSETKRYDLALKLITTSNKAVCEAMFIPVEAGTRYKAEFENSGLLVSSKDKFQCPYTGEMVHFLSTNPLEFDRLRKTNDTQLNLFSDEQ
ncbi:MAG: hypothetical protein AB7U05_09515 [Mangrovibacterium sp.]